MKKLALLLAVLGLVATGCDTTTIDQSNLKPSNDQQSSITPPEGKVPRTPELTPMPVLKTQSSCDPNYSGCVPIASDVDCAGGSGNGPAYVEGPIKVTGTDIYRLDSDHDGIACE